VKRVPWGQKRGEKTRVPPRRGVVERKIKKERKESGEKGTTGEDFVLALTQRNQQENRPV